MTAKTRAIPFLHRDSFIAYRDIFVAVLSSGNTTSPYCRAVRQHAETTTNMKERTSLSTKLITSHLLLLPIILMIGYLIKYDTFLILAITQLILIITFTSGYWEFFGQKSRVIYAIGIESLILILLITKIMRPEVAQSNPVFGIVLIIILGYLFFELIKIIVVILRHEKNSVEITFPLKNGTYLITDGGNSKISRLMNYHYYSPIHKRKKTNNSMKFATDIVKIGIQEKFISTSKE